MSDTSENPAPAKPAPLAPGDATALTVRQRAFPLPHGMVVAAWILNAILLLMSVSAFFDDPRMAQAYAEENAWLLAGEEPGLAEGSMSAGERNRRMGYATGIGLLAAGSMLCIVVGLFAGSSRHRTIRSWLGLTALVAGWLVVLDILAGNLLGRASDRVFRRKIAEFERIAAPLRDDWPRDDGSNDLLGAFNAYPAGRPTTLMVIAAPPGELRRSPIASVERSDAGALRFQLAGSDAGAWLEWHPGGSKPQSFSSQMILNAGYELTRDAPLGNGWHLTRYELKGVGYVF